MYVMLEIRMMLELKILLDMEKIRETEIRMGC